MRKFAGALIVVALVAALSGYLFGQSAATAPPRAAGGAGARVAPAATAAVVAQPKTVKQKARKPKTKRGAQPAAATPAEVPLPPPDTPLAAIRDALEAQARAGDARAACRLGHELLRCQRTFERRMPDAESMLARGARDNVEREVDFIARMENRIEATRAICAGVELEDTREAFRWLQQAADAGNVAAMATYVRQPAIPMDRWIAEADKLVAYRENAPRYAQLALEHGEPRVLGLMAAAHFDGGGEPLRVYGNFLDGLAPRDNVRAYAYAVLADRLFPPRETATFEFSEQRRIKPVLERLERELTPAQRAQGAALADALAANQFRATAPRPVVPTDGPAFDRCDL